MPKVKHFVISFAFGALLLGGIEVLGALFSAKTPEEKEKEAKGFDPSEIPDIAGYPPVNLPPDAGVVLASLPKT
jgi:hypothetical protein